MIAAKNYQSEAVIREMAARAFPERELAEICELTEGMCNVIYRVGFADGGAAILKVGPESARNTLRNEKNMMQVEIRASAAGGAPGDRRAQAVCRRRQQNAVLWAYFLMKTEFTPAERRRMIWYDLFLCGTMISEEVFREYEPGTQSGWIRPFFDDAMKELKA